MKIVYVASDFDAPGCYRCLFPGRELRKLGHETGLPPYLRDTSDGKDIVTYHTLEDSFGRGKVEPFADIWVLQQRRERDWVTDWITALRVSGVATVAEVDDNYLELPEYNPAWKGTHPYRRPDGHIYTRAAREATLKDPAFRKKFGGTFPKSRYNRDWMHEGFRLVDAMTTSTPYLKHIYSRFNPNIQVIRNYLDWEMWEKVQPQYEVERKRLRVGYMGVHAYRTKDLDVLRPWFSRWLQSHPEVDFVATEDATHDYLGISKAQRVTTGRVHFRDMTSPSITAVMDIGLVPLDMNPLNEGKSHLKGMEYNACGTPFVASPTESYKDYWCAGENGFLAANESEWRDHLESLVGQEDLRRHMGAQGRKKAAAHTIQRNVGEWESFYLGVLGDDIRALCRQAVSKGAIQKLSELEGLVKVLLGRPLKTVVEIGSARGGTFFVWSQLAEEDALLVSIDLPGGDFGGVETGRLKTKGGIDRYGARNLERMRSYLKPGQTAHFIQGNSQNPETKGRLLDVLDGRPIDFLFIDGDHSYEGVKRDWELYGDLADVIAFHDILDKPAEPRSQVDRLWKEVRRAYPVREFVAPEEHWGYGRWGGIGVVFNERVASLAA